MEGIKAHWNKIVSLSLEVWWFIQFLNLMKELTHNLDFKDIFVDRQSYSLSSEAYLSIPSEQKIDHENVGHHHLNKISVFRLRCDHASSLVLLYVLSVAS